MTSLRSTVLLTSVSVLVSFSALAQTATTSLRGTITDPNGALVTNATVTLNNAATGFSRTTKTAGDGVYQYVQVPPATYILTVEKGKAAADDDFGPFAERAKKRGFAVEEMEADHNPQWSAPEALVERLDRAARVAR